MLQVQRRVVLSMGCALLVGASLWIAGCAGSGNRASSPSKSGHVSVAPTATVHGPYRRGEVVVVGRMEFELVSWKVLNPEAIRLGERSMTGPWTTSTVATAGRNYVDAAVRIHDLDATQSPFTREPQLGDPYVMVGGRRFSQVSGAREGRGGGFTTTIFITEFELPKETSGAVLYWPASESATQVVSFILR
jgi:hypothetical protein